MNGLNVRFFAALRPSMKDKPECECAQCEFGWVQYVKEASWMYDNYFPFIQRFVGHKLSDVWDKGVPKPPKGVPDGGSPPPQEVPWYGQTQANPPATKAQLDIFDSPGTPPWFPEAAVQKGPNKGSMRKQFITKLVCKKKDGAYTVLQQFAWDFYRDLKAEPEWSRFELFSDKKNNKKKGAECLK